MIQFFRKIRQRLLTENKYSRYVIYAIGEIVLVIIGILIALQINNWNNENQLNKLERKYLKEIKHNLEFDLVDVQFNIDFNESKFRSNELILQFLNQENEYSDSLKFHFGNLIGATRTLPNISTYENLKATGLEIISNDSLRQEITKLYSYTYLNIIDFEKQDDHPFHYEVFLPEISKAINIEEVWKSGEPIDRLKILDNYQLKNALKINILNRRHMLKWYRGLKSKVQQCIILINTELEK